MSEEFSVRKCMSFGEAGSVETRLHRKGPTLGLSPQCIWLSDPLSVKCIRGDQKLGTECCGQAKGMAVQVRKADF